MLFNAVVMNFPTLTFFKILSIMQSVHSRRWAYRVQIRLCACEVVSERFHNNQNESEMIYKNSHRKKFLVFVVKRGLCWFSLSYVNMSGAFRNNSE